MGEYFFGLMLGFFLGVIVFGSIESDEKKDAVKAGWIEVDSVAYVLRKADVVEVKELKQRLGR